MRGTVAAGGALTLAVVAAISAIMAITVAQTALRALDPPVGLWRAQVHEVPTLGPGDAFCIAEADARPREKIATRGFRAPACLPGGYGVPEGETFVMHLRYDGSCDALRLDGPWRSATARFGVECVGADEARARGGALVKDGPVWRWAAAPPPR